MSDRLRLACNLRVACLVPLFFAAGPPAPAETSLVIDGFDYADSAPVGDFTLYFNSGGGWYAENAVSRVR